jgi:hypothetical protein
VLGVGVRVSVRVRVSVMVRVRVSVRVSVMLTRHGIMEERNSFLKRPRHVFF